MSKKNFPPGADYHSAKVPGDVQSDPVGQRLVITKGSPPHDSLKPNPSKIGLPPPVVNLLREFVLTVNEFDHWIMTGGTASSIHYSPHEKQKVSADQMSVFHS